MNELRYTLLTDGPSDRALIPILTWLLRANGITYAIQPAWADLRRLPRKPKELSDRMKKSLELYPCDILFVHRDAEREPYQIRKDEIQKAVRAMQTEMPVVCVIPVRMTEAWLLFDEQAIRTASGNPNGRCVLQLPQLRQIETLPDPKEDLNKLLRTASELSNRRRKQNIPQQVQRVAEFINDFSDFSPLRDLEAFRALEADIAETVAHQGWLEG